MHHPTDRITHTTVFVTPVVEHWLEREIAQWVHPMKDRSDDPSDHERTLLPRSYISPPTMMYVWLLNCMVTFTEHLGPWTSIEVEMKGHILHLSWLHGVVSSVLLIVGRSLDRKSMSRIFVPRLYAISGGWLKILARKDSSFSK